MVTAVMIGMQFASIFYIIPLAAALAAEPDLVGIVRRSITVENENTRRARSYTFLQRDEQRRLDSSGAAPYTVLGWRAPNITAAVKALTKAGVQFERYPGMQQDELGIWTSPGDGKVAWFKDPDGNTLSISQHHSA